MKDHHAVDTHITEMHGEPIRLAQLLDERGERRVAEVLDGERLGMQEGDTTELRN